MPYLVDGNNLAHSLGLSREGLADRQACTKAVGTFCHAQGARATIVFDGPPLEGPERPLSTSRVRVIFSGSGSADDTILRLVADSSTPRDFTVVTSDKSLGDKAKHRGAALEKTHEFARRLDKTRTRPSGGPAKPAHKESPAEIAAWLSVFDPRRR